MELQVIESIKPKIVFNEEEIEQYLTENLAKYENLVVTEATLKDDTKIKQELKKLADGISRFRIDTTKEMSTEINDFADKLKNLFAKVMIIHDRINAQIKVFEDERKAKKENEVKAIVAMVAAEYQLEEKYASQLTIDTSYLTKTMTASKITTDLKNRAEILKSAQNAVAMHNQLVVNTCEMYPDLNIDPTPWVKLLETNDVAIVIADLNKFTSEKMMQKQEAERKRLEDELKEKQRQIEEQMNAPQPEPVVHSEPVPVKNGVYTHILQISGSEQQMHMLHDFLTNNKFEFKTLK